MITEDGAFVFVGIENNNPAILVLNPDFSLRFFKSYSAYGKGGFQDVVQRKNGSLAIVGYSFNEALYGYELNPAAFMTQISPTTGAIEDLYIYKEIHQFTFVGETQEEELLLGGHIVGTAVDVKYKKGSSPLYNVYGVGTARHSVVTSITETSDGNYLRLSNRSDPNGVNFYEIISEILDQNLDFQNNSTTYFPRVLFGRSSWQWTGYFSPILGVDVIPKSGTDRYYMATLTSAWDTVLLKSLAQISWTELDHDGTIFNKSDFKGEGQAMFQGMVPFSKGFILYGATMKPNESFNNFNYSAYVVAIDGEGNTLWEATIGSEANAESFFNAREVNNILQFGGLSLDQNKNASFFQCNYDLEGNQVELQ